MMKKLGIGLIGLAAMVMSSQGADIMVDSFTNGTPIAVNGRVQVGQIDAGWVMPTGPSGNSEWEILTDQMENSATNSGGYPGAVPAEGVLVNVVSHAPDTNNIVDVSLDYDVATGDVLYVHLWGLDSTNALDGNWFANGQGGSGALSDKTDRNAGLDAFNLKDGGACGSVGQAIVALTGSGTYTNSIVIADLGVSGVENAGDFEYYLIGFAKDENGTNGTTSVDNLSITTSYVAPPPPAESGIIANPFFPNQDVLVSQLNVNTDTDIRYTPAQSTALGQSFSFASAQSLGAFTVQKAGDLDVISDGTNVLTLWIGEYDSTSDPSNHVVGATLYTNTFEITGNSFVDGYFYTFNLTSNIPLAAGTEYAFQLTWTSADVTHNFGINRYYDNPTGSGIDQYPDGTIIYQSGVAGVLPATSLINEPDNDMTFALHSSEVGVDAFVIVDPSEIFMAFDSAATNLTTGSVDMAYNSSTNMDITITVSDESVLGSFSVLTATPQTLTVPYPETTPVEVQFDNSAASLTAGTSATCLVTIAWSEAGGGESGSVVVPVTAFAAYGPNENNTFNKTLGTWGDSANWSKGRVPGTLGPERGIIQQSGRVCNVETNFTGLFPCKVWVRTTSGVANILNVGADLKGVGQIHVGQSAGSYGILNHTAGAVETPSLTVAHSGGAVSNSVYTQTGGSVDVNSLTVNPAGELKLDGGTMDISTGMTIASNGVVNVNGGDLTLDQGPANISVGTADGLLKVQSGSLTTLGTAAADVFSLGVDLEVSGGSVVLNGQNKIKKMKVIGEEAIISISRLNRPSSGKTLLTFELGSHGVSTIKLVSWSHLDGTDIVVDGSNYTGGETNITLMAGGSFQDVSTNVVVQNFSGDYAATVTQSVDTDTVELIITVGGPDISLDIPSGGPVSISWPIEYGDGYNVMTNADLVYGTWGDADWTPYLDGDVYRATNSIGAEPVLFYRLENE